MSFRTRLILAFTTVVLIPIALLAFGLRQEMARRLSAEYRVRLERVLEIVREDLARESNAVAERLASLAQAIRDDNRFRLAAVAGVESEREYVLDYAGRAMRLTGLSMLQIQDHEGRIISSGHFRNEHGRLDSALVPALRSTGDIALIVARDPVRDFIALARAQDVQLGNRSFTIVGGVAIDEAFLARLARDESVVLSLTHPGGILSTRGSSQLSTTPPSAGEPSDTASGGLRVPLIASRGAGTQVDEARVEVLQSLEPLRELLRSADSWFLLATAGTALAALIAAFWVSSRLSGRLSALAAKTAVLDLDRLDVDFDPGADEVGTLSRLLGDLASRLRTSTARVRDAERRATIGDLARQINHDIKNGLIPLRNVMRHLAQVERAEPEALPAVFAERRPTIDSSIAYLETLAASYQRLSPPQVRRDCDVNALIDDVVHAAQGHEHVELQTRLAPDLPRVTGDPVGLRRILENLTANAVDSLEGRSGRVTVATEMVGRDDEAPAIRITVADTGRGMAPEEAAQIFNDFYTTKSTGTGLGLSIVRRLLMDLGGTIRVESAVGRGTRMIVELPAARAGRRRSMQPGATETGS